MRAALLGAILMASALRVAAAAPDGAEPDAAVAQARALYAAAEGEVAAGQYAAAARDYAAAYELTHDPVLFFKIGAAHARAGDCPAAVEYLRRYLREAAPVERYVALTRRRLAGCHATDAPDPVTPTPNAPPAGPPGPPDRPGVHRGAWLATAGALALALTGIVLAEAARSAETDVQDLYVGFQGTPPTYDAALQRRYQDLLDEGHRYEHGSWAALGLAAAAAGTAAILFTRHDVRIAPLATPTSGGVAASVRF